jgi:hypothetical protein
MPELGWQPQGNGLYATVARTAENNLSDAPLLWQDVAPAI